MEEKVINCWKKKKNDEKYDSKEFNHNKRREDESKIVSKNVRVLVIFVWENRGKRWYIIQRNPEKESPRNISTTKDKKKQDTK